jgi:hypothetical protein
VSGFRVRSSHATARWLLGGTWLALATLKILHPPATPLDRLAEHLAIGPSLFRVGYWFSVAVESAVGLGLLAPWRRELAYWASFCISGLALTGWLFVEPLRSGCVCLGTVVRLGIYSKLVLILWLLAASYYLVARYAVRPRGTDAS